MMTIKDRTQLMNMEMEVLPLLREEMGQEIEIMLAHGLKDEIVQDPTKLFKYLSQKGFVENIFDNLLNFHCPPGDDYWGCQTGCRCSCPSCWQDWLQTHGYKEVNVHEFLEEYR